MTYERPNSAIGAALASARLEGPLGVFVDGENLQSWAAAPILALLERHCAPSVCRVYGNVDHLNGWRSAPAFEVIHTGVVGGGGDIVKNAADIRIAVDVMEFALRDGGKTVFLCSSDRDFTPLVWALRRLGVNVVGAGEAKATESLRQAFGAFEVLSPPEKVAPSGQPTGTYAGPSTPLEKKIFAVAERLGACEAGAFISDFNGEMRRTYDFKISSLPNPADRQWRKYFANRPDTYRVDPKGPKARVHIVRKAPK